MGTDIQLYRRPDALLATAEGLGLLVSKQDRKLLTVGDSINWQPISELPEAVQVQKIGALLIGVFGDLGISRKPEREDGARFMQLVVEHFGELGVSDMKAAFELYILGELDGHLPRDKNAPRGVLHHYQQFSGAFYIQVLRAYKRKKSEAVMDLHGKVNTLLLEAATRSGIGEQRDAYLKLVRDQIQRWCKPRDGAEAQWTMLVDTTLADLLIKLKVMDGMPVATEADFEKAQNAIVKNKSWTFQQAINNAVKRGVVPDDLELRTWVICLRRTIKEALLNCDYDMVMKRMDWMIENNRKRHGLDEA